MSEKKVLQMLLGVLGMFLMFSVGVSADWSDSSKVYYEKYLELEKTYGAPAITYAGKPNDKYQSLEKSYMTGICGVKLFDFNQDGEDEILFVYQNGIMEDLETTIDYDTGEEGEWRSPKQNGYSFEIYSCQDNELNLIYEQDSVGGYIGYVKEFPSEWNDYKSNEGDIISLIEIVKLQDQTTAVRITNGAGQDERHVKDIYWTYITWDGTKCTETKLGYQDGELRYGEVPISVEEWNETFVVSEILYSAAYSDNVFFGKIVDDNWNRGFEIEDTLMATENEIETIRTGKKEEKLSTATEYVGPYENILRWYSILDCLTTRVDVNDINNLKIVIELFSGEKIDSDFGADEIEEGFFYEFEYALYDIDQNGVPELLVHNCIGEAASFLVIYTVEKGNLVQLTDKMECSHVSFFGNGKKLMWRWGMSGIETGFLLNEKGEQDEEVSDLLPELLWNTYWPIEFAKVEDTGLLYRTAKEENDF